MAKNANIQTPDNDFGLRSVLCNMKGYSFYLLLPAFLICGILSAQDTLVIADDAQVKEEQLKIKKREIQPKKSLQLSLILPGSGQVYNGRWWKLPLVYGAMGGMIYAIDYNTGQYKRLKTALNLKRNDEEHEFSGTSIDNVRSLQTLRDQFDKNRQLSYIGLVVVYALQAVEAYVDAHLQNFDIDDDLGIRLQPQLDLAPVIGRPVFGMAVTIPLNKAPESHRSHDSKFRDLMTR